MKKSIVGLALAAAFTSQAALAAYVPTWTALTYATWTASTFTGNAGVTTSDSTLSWGTSTGLGQSSLVLAPSTSGAAYSNDVTTDGGPTTDAAFELTHNNNPIGGTSLLTAQMRVDVDLKAGAGELPAAPTAYSGFLLYDILFKETPNDLAGCTWLVAGTVGCSDIFVVTNSSVVDLFTYDGIEYFIRYSSPDFDTVLSNDACKAAGAAAGCKGFITAEGSNSLRREITMEIGTVVPEPGSLALLGAGLLGLAALRRRKAA